MRAKKMKNCYCQKDENEMILNVCSHCENGENDGTCKAYLSQYSKVVEKWNDRNSPTQDGANNAIIELENGTQIKVVYMYEDCMWMPE